MYVKRYNKIVLQVIKLGEMQRNQGGVFLNGLNWLSSTVKKYIWSSNNVERNQPFLIQNIQYTLSKKTKEEAKQIILMKMRKPSSQNKMLIRLNKIKQFMEDKTEFEKPQQLVCPVCIDIFIKPVVTLCGHTFCYRCLDQAILFNSNCPVCRTFLRGTDMAPCKSLHNIIFTYLSKFNNPIYKTFYQEKVRQYELWMTKRTLNSSNFKIGSFIDVRDTEFIWCKAVINQIYRKDKDNKISSILIHYLGWNSVYDQIIQISSSRIATESFYSSRPDIPHYHINSQNDQNMYSYVVIGEPYLPNVQRIEIQDIDDNLDLIDSELVQNQSINNQVGVSRIDFGLNLDYIMVQSQQNSQIEDNPQNECNSEDAQKKSSYSALNNFISNFIEVQQQQKFDGEQKQDQRQIFDLDLDIIFSQDRQSNNKQYEKQQNF